MDFYYFPEPILLKSTEKVARFDADLEKIVRQMFQKMYESKGVGLAANQVGVNKMVAVINPTGEAKDELVLINPEIIKSEDSESKEEGCLSCPGINAEIKRARRIKVRFQDLKGDVRIIEAQDLLARIIQHEVDHLKGRVIIERMSPAARIIHKSHIESLRKNYQKGE